MGKLISLFSVSPVWYYIEPQEYKIVGEHDVDENVIYISLVSHCVCS